jgi:hypothetical protein
MSQTLHYDSDHICTCWQATDGWSPVDLLTAFVRRTAHNTKVLIERNRQRQLDAVLPELIDMPLDEATRRTARLYWQTYERRHVK